MSNNYDLPTLIYMEACCIKHYCPSYDSRKRDNEEHIFSKIFQSNGQISH